MHDDTELLLQSASRGDAIAVDALLTRYLPQLRAFVRLNLGGQILAKEAPEDIEQSVCREVLQDVSDFDYRGEAAFKQWLFLCATRKIRDRAKFYNRARRDQARERELSDDPELLSGYATLTTPSAVVVHREEIDRLHEAFDKLSDDHRAVITMAKYLGMSHADIAKEMDRSEGAVAVLLHRALARLGLLLDSAD